VRVVNGQMPANALRAGREADGTPIYIARAPHEGGVVVGKAWPGDPTAAFPYGGQEIRLGNYEVYVGTGTWSKRMAGQSVPSNAIPAGREADGTPLYVARAPVGGGTHVGKARGTAAFISYGGREEVVSPFWVMVPLPTDDTGSADGNTTQTIQLEDINEWLCPNRRTQGDGEFDGHGPRIKCEVQLMIADGGRSLNARITFWAQETQHDWSTAEGIWLKKVYEAPYGKRISRIVSDQASRTQFISPPGGFQFLVPGADVARTVNGFLDGLGGTIANALFALHGLPPQDYSGFARLVTGKVDNGNTAVRIPAIEGTLVKFFTIVGDTGGGDISNDDNCNDDTRIVSIEFAPVKVEFATGQN
jgi:hypothetical protein